jgi:glycerol-3-phosphate acyltransferase PlsX
MTQRPTLILDVMGADLGSGEMVRGAVDAITAVDGRDFHLVIVSAEDAAAEQQYMAELERACAGTPCTAELIHATQKLPKEIDSPVDIYKEFPDSSIRAAMNRAKDAGPCAVISPGTTGLVMLAGLYTLGRVRGIDRTPIGTPMPTLGKELFYVDGGSNVDCRPQQLYQFAVLAHLYLKHVRRVSRPSIALLSNGTEEYKGNTVVREAYKLLEADGELNFHGFIEGHSMFEGNLDIMVCDGFIGNILLKFAEGVAETIFTLIRQELKRDLKAGIAAKLFQKPAYRRVGDRLDYAQFGGAPLLGLKGNVIICHGRSPAKAIRNALRVGYDLAQSNIADNVAEYMEARASR